MRDELEYIHFGEKLKALRVFKNIDITDLAKRIDRSPEFIDELESHSSWDNLGINFNDVAGLAKALEIRADYFFNDLSFEQQLERDKIHEKPDFQEMMAMLRQLPKETQEYYRSLLAKLGNQN